MQLAVYTGKANTTHVTIGGAKLAFDRNSPTMVTDDNVTALRASAISEDFQFLEFGAEIPPAFSRADGRPIHVQLESRGLIPVSALRALDVLRKGFPSNPLHIQCAPWIAPALPPGAQLINAADSRVQYYRSYKFGTDLNPNVYSPFALRAASLETLSLSVINALGDFGEPETPFGANWFTGDGPRVVFLAAAGRASEIAQALDTKARVTILPSDSPAVLTAEAARAVISADVVIAPAGCGAYLAATFGARVFYYGADPGAYVVSQIGRYETAAQLEFSPQRSAGESAARLSELIDTSLGDSHGKERTRETDSQSDRNEIADGESAGRRSKRRRARRKN